MISVYNKKSIFVQFVISILIVVVIAAICYAWSNFIDYRSVALILLATVFILSIFYSFYPVLAAAFLSAVIYDFLFIPPHFTLHIKNSEDVLMLSMYFIIAVINGTLTSKLRQYEKINMQRKEREIAINLYKTIFESISHELRTPISTIVGASDNLLQKDNALSDIDRNYLVDEISIAAFRLNRLVDNLLNMQRLESGLMKIKLDWCDVSELLNLAVNRIKNDYKNHKFIVELEKDFPLIKLDFGLIEQVVYNILHNSVLYTPENSTITIKATFVENMFNLTIADEGTGFSEEELQKLFSKFYRGKKSGTGGIGLGLSIAKGFVEAHNGIIKVENGNVNGAVFTISIPTESLKLEENED